MRIRALSAALTGLALMPLAGGAQAASPGTYVGGGVALQDVDTFDDGVALSLRGAVGLPGALGNGIPGVFSVEGEITRTIVSPERDLPFPATGEAEVDITTLGGYGVYTYPVDRIRLRGRVGVIYEDIAVDGFDDDSEVGLSLGVGAGFMVTRQVELAANYTYIEDDVEHLGINALYHF